MSKKKPTATISAIGADGRIIGLLLPVLTKLGISVPRVRPDMLVGFINGLLDENILLWSEIWGEGNQIGIQISSSRPFFEGQEAEIRAKVEQANSLPECGTGEDRWLKIGITSPRPSGGRNVALIARIMPTAGELTPEFCEQKITAIIEFMRKEWPMK